MSLILNRKASPKKVKRSELKPWFECPERELVEPKNKIGHLVYSWPF